MRGIVFGFIFTVCVVGFAALALLSFNGCGEQSTTMECFHSNDPTGYSCYPSGGYPEAEFGPPVGEGGYK